MQVRDLYEHFVSMPDRRAGVKYEDALQRWEQHTDNPVASDLTNECIMSFRQTCAADGIEGGRFSGCWRYVHSIPRVASGSRIAVS